MNLILAAASSAGFPWALVTALGALLLNVLGFGYWAGRIGTRLDNQAEKLDALGKGLDDRIDLKILRCRQAPVACPIPRASAEDTNPRGVPVLDGG